MEDFHGEPYEASDNEDKSDSLPVILIMLLAIVLTVSTAIYFLIQ